jgi:hypothetical protein
MEIVMKRLLAATLVASAAFAAVPLAAQDEAAQDDVRMSIVYGEDAAPACPEGEICVVARLPEAERYRIPPTLRFSDDPANTAWTRRVERLEMIGAFGALSCSPAGAGGFTGCTQQLIQQAYGDRAEGAEVRFSELIAAARAERLGTIDATAAEEQARVEAIEREYMERLERERGDTTPGEEAPLPSPKAEPIMQTPEG